MADFGDSDPEDAYDVEDPPLVRYRLLRLWVASIALEQARGDHEKVRVLARIQAARWAVGLLLGEKLPKKQEQVRAALSTWLDEMLDDEGTL